MAKKSHDFRTSAPNHTSGKTDLISFDANIVAVSQETSPKSEPVTDIASEPKSTLPQMVSAVSVPYSQQSGLRPDCKDLG
ncbi:hypothetical protein Ddc_00954 [Ditylenchus destructor]|nr:hypothetical protein Ddc_00954 [Ditylenchus destructor]